MTRVLRFQAWQLLLLAVVTLFLSHSGFAQSWTGSPGVTGDLYRLGRTAVGVVPSSGDPGNNALFLVGDLTLPTHFNQSQKRIAQLESGVFAGTSVNDQWIGVGRSLDQNRNTYGMQLRWRTDFAHFLLDTLETSTIRHGLIQWGHLAQSQMRFQHIPTADGETGNAVNIMTLDPSGRVGINTTTPVSALDVDGHVTLSGADSRVISMDRDGRLNLFPYENAVKSASWIEMHRLGGSSRGQLNLAGKRIMFFYDSDTSGIGMVGMGLDSTGNFGVGYGSNSPEARLHVKDTALGQQERAALIEYGRLSGNVAYGLRLNADPLEDNGILIGQKTWSSVNTNNQEGFSTIELSHSESQSDHAEITGVYGRSEVTKLTTGSGEESRVLGGDFRVASLASPLTLSGSGDHIITGVSGLVSGSVDVADASVQAIIAGVYGSSEATGNASSYAGYFDGNNYVRDSIGIGTKDPIARLDAKGDLALSAPPAWGRRIFTGDDKRLNIYTNSSAANSSSWIELYGLKEQTESSRGQLALGGKHIKFYTDSDSSGSIGSVGMLIDSAGRVAIGTDSVAEGYMLTVDGHIKTKKVLVTQLNWPDYVFEDDYSLRSLSEVERYIDEHSHLPGIPSEKEVLNEGLDMGSMQARLLQKVEELTLYIIAQEKRIAELEEQSTHH